MIVEKRPAEAGFSSGSLAPQGPARGVIVPAGDGASFSVVGSVGADITGSPDVICGSCGGGGMPASAYFTGNQTAQINSYYCGPAAVHEALGDFGLNLSQSQIASLLKTTTAGTAWSGGGTSPTGYPVADAMNAMQGVNHYVPQYVSSATSSVIYTYEEDLMSDVYGMGAPVIGDAWEKSGQDHLAGHPVVDTIYHWFTIRGYQDSGSSTMYEDSVHNATSISWYAGVPAYTTYPSSKIVNIVTGRGYVW
jgi:hypothetical protein